MEADCLVDRRVARARLAALNRRERTADEPAGECARRLAERIEGLRVPPGLVLDAGCGAQPGQMAGAVLKREVIGIDWCAQLLPGGAVAADIAALPFADASFGSVWCNLCLPWVANPPQALAELRRVLAAGGLCLIATLGPDSLQEVRRAFSDERPHTMGFLDLHDLGDMLMACGFAEPVIEAETFTFEYPDGRRLLAELSGWGALAAPGMHKALTGRATLAAAAAALAPAGVASLTFEVIFAHAWAVPKRPAKFPDVWQPIAFPGADVR